MCWLVNFRLNQNREAGSNIYIFFLRSDINVSHDECAENVNKSGINIFEWKIVSICKRRSAIDRVAVLKCNIYFNHATCFWDCNKALKLYSISRWDKGRVKKTRDENHNWTIWQRTWKYNETWILYVSNAIALILYVNLNSDVWWLSFIYSHFIFIFTVVLYACKAQSTRSVHRSF